MSLWEVVRRKYTLSVEHPDNGKVVFIEDYTDERFARALCAILNSTPTYKFSRTMKEMTQLGIPEIL